MLVSSVTRASVWHSEATYASMGCPTCVASPTTTRSTVCELKSASEAYVWLSEQMIASRGAPA